MIFSSNAQSFIASNKFFEKIPRIVLTKTLRAVTKVVHRSLLAKTPVYTGETVRNYILTMDSPHGGVVFPPIGIQDTGPTNSMSLGTEPRRAANEAASLATQGNLNLSDPFKKIFISNASPAVAGLEMGLLPPPPLRSRSPQGMFAITLMEVSARLSSGALK